MVFPSCTKEVALPTPLTPMFPRLFHTSPLQHCAHLELVKYLLHVIFPNDTTVSSARARTISILFTTILLYISLTVSRNTIHKEVSKKNEHKRSIAEQQQKSHRNTKRQIKHEDGQCTND